MSEREVVSQISQRWVGNLKKLIQCVSYFHLAFLTLLRCKFLQPFSDCFLGARFWNGSFENVNFEPFGCFPSGKGEKGNRWNKGCCKRAEGEQEEECLGATMTFSLVNVAFDFQKGWHFSLAQAGRNVTIQLRNGFELYFKLPWLQHLLQEAGEKCR